MPLTDSALHASGVTVSFDRATVLKCVDLSLRAGRVTALVGPNGSGKSTLLRTMARLQRADSGTVSLAEIEDAQVLSARAFSRRVGMLAQQRPVPAGITVADLVGYGRYPYRSGWRGADPGGMEAIQKALSLTGLEPIMSEALETLSGGQLQRAWLACALAQDTDVLLLDEPTNHLDLRYQAETLDLIRQLADDHQVTVGVVLHDLGHAAQIADQIAVLEQGSIVAAGPPEDALDAELLSKVYEIPIDVRPDPLDGTLEIRVARRRRTQAKGAEVLS